MSYSRWINSEFYTYWCVSDAKIKEDELFALHFDLDNSYNIKYTDICKMIEDEEYFMNFFQNEIGNNCGDLIPGNDADYHEIMSYMIRFIDDIENEYKENGNT